MTEAAPLPDDEHEGSVYSKDYWDTVFEQVGRRPLVKAALAVLALLYASAIYAPFLANDRPFVFEGVDYKEYSDHRRNFVAFAEGVAELVRKSEADFAPKEEQQSEGRTPGQRYAAALDAELLGLSTSIAGMLQFLPPAEAGALRGLEQRMGEAAAQVRSGNRAAADSIAQAGVDEAIALRSSYRAEREGGAGGKQLQPVRRYPIFESTSGQEVFFMWLWMLVLTWPVWNRLVNRLWLAGDRERIRKWRRWKLAAVLGSSLGAGLLWSLLVGGEMVFLGSFYKTRLTQGDIVASRASFPPLAMGFPETHMSERFRPPTWRRDSELDEDGHPKFGPRRPVPDALGLMPPALDIDVRYAEPGINHPGRFLLGTDNMGRDLLVRILYGGRISLMVGILSTALLVSIGVVMGSLAGYFGGWVDNVISRLIEIFQSVPAFFIILAAVAMIPDDEVHPIFAIVIVIALVRWTGVARLIRAEFLRLKEQEFVIAARALGFSNRRVIFRHVLPNGLGPVLVAAAFSVAAGILTESAISFLGFGVKLPIPSWGALLSEARGVSEYWWLQIFPGVLIFVTVFCYNIVGEGVRDALDPRRKV